MAKKSTVKVRLVPEDKADSKFYYYAKKPTSGLKAKDKLRMKKSLFVLLFFPMIFFGQNQSFELGLLFGGSLNSLNYIESNQEEQKLIETLTIRSMESLNTVEKWRIGKWKLPNNELHIVEIPKVRFRMVEHYHVAYHVFVK